MSSALQDWRWFSLVFHAVISHCSLTTRFPAVTRNTALWKGARNSNFNSSYEYISKGQILWNDTLQSLETSHQWGEISLKAEIIQVSCRYLHLQHTLPQRLINLVSGTYSSTFEIQKHMTFLNLKTLSSSFISKLLIEDLDCSLNSNNTDQHKQLKCLSVLIDQIFLVLEKWYNIEIKFPNRSSVFPATVRSLAVFAKWQPAVETWLSAYISIHFLTFDIINIQQNFLQDHWT